MLRLVAPLFFLVCGAFDSSGRELRLPERPINAQSGSAFAEIVTNWDLATRDRAILEQVIAGNVPEFWRHFVKVEVEHPVGSATHRAAYWVSPDYACVGSDADYFLTPMAPGTAQELADLLECTVPTRKMVDDIYRAAAVKLAPAPMPPNPEMTTLPAFRLHNDAVRSQRASFLTLHPLGALVAGHKKDVVVSRQIEPGSSKVAIYGWHQFGGEPIQPLYTGHSAQWVDYSHGIRLVERKLLLDGVSTTTEGVLADPALADLLSDEGVLATPRYGEAGARAALANPWREETELLQMERGVRVWLNTTAENVFDSEKPTKLILYALPNGNTIEQTMGRHIDPGEDWHFDIQHIAAQMRWLRAHVNDANLAIAYLECAGKAWPAWRRENDPENTRIPKIVDELAHRFPQNGFKLVLTGHSGGGSFTFGYLNGVDRIPDYIERIAFLDSNYAYDPAQGHDKKLADWLAADPERYLCVLAYNDAIALLNGQPFVSAAGGTWGRSHAMLDNLAQHFGFTPTDDPDLQRRSALDGRVNFLLRENPTRAIFHTRMVEMNGFIHALLSGTDMEEQGYQYLGARAYSHYISAE